MRNEKFAQSFIGSDIGEAIDACCGICSFFCSMVYEAGSLGMCAMCVMWRCCVQVICDACLSHLDELTNSLDVMT